MRCFDVADVEINKAHIEEAALALEQALALLRVATLKGLHIWEIILEPYFSLVLTDTVLYSPGGGRHHRRGRRHFDKTLISVQPEDSGSTGLAVRV